MPAIVEEDDDYDDDIPATQIENASLELALTEMFNFYSRRYREKYDDFDQ